MFKVTENGTNRLDIELSGKLDSEGMRNALDELVEKSEHIQQGRMLYEVVEFQLPSLEAIAIELSRLPAMFRLMKKFERAAVLSDKNWIKTVSEIEGALIPGLEIKAFDRNQREEAEAWLIG
ncbi:SpoIIAA family protein [Desulfogranum mediterraneum]|uniref:STAS/SEC14 domain-containing protein n=1 Tax=Desulfogranum mediterraneum TaxID=160661 RepID=UPI000404BF60|nr:STAS/SEC14 domain-containing protein [Desulfogranum mediterraneum]